ncbi:MAG TPA: hypothetical protein VH520_06635 [Streptosporangiaceae bacterium]
MTSEPEDPHENDGPHHTEILDVSYGPPRRRPRLTGLLAVAVIALAGGGGIAYVATHSGDNVNTVASRSGAQSPSPSPAPSAPSGRKHGPGGFGRFGALGGLGMAGLGGAIHGQVTVPKSGGGYQTVEVQRGTVTAVSSSSITVKSADGYSATYAVSSSTEVNAQAAGIGTVKDGDTVALTATGAGKPATAASIIDLTSIKSSRGSFGFPAGPPRGNQS